MADELHGGKRKRASVTKAFMALGMLGLALIVLVGAPQISQGAGIIATALIAGATWALKELHEEAKTRRNVAAGYISAIRQHRREVADSLSDAELDRFVALAPSIADGTEAPATRGVTVDRYADLPALKDSRHALSPETVEVLLQWKIMDTELHHVYDLLGTLELSRISPARLTAYFDWVRTYRDRYFAAGDDCIAALDRETAYNALADALSVPDQPG